MKIRYFSGYGGGLDRGLALYLKTLTDDFSGLAASEQFVALPFDTQLAQARSLMDDLDDGLLVANSYGGYLALNALVDAEQPSFRLLLLSPLIAISSDFDSPTSALKALPVGGTSLLDAIENRRLALPRETHIVTGLQDEICDPMLAKAFAEIYPVVKLTLVSGEGHMLSEAVVASHIDNILQ